MERRRIMSIDYKFICDGCHKSGGHFNRNDAHVIDSLQFLIKHVDQCGRRFIRIISDYDDEYFAMRKYPPYDDLYPEDKSKSLDDYFPCSGDWDKGRYTKGFEAYEIRRKAKKEAIEAEYIKEMEELKNKKRGRKKVDLPLEVKRRIKKEKVCECILRGFKMEAGVTNPTPEGDEYTLDEDGEKKTKYYYFNICSKCYRKWRNKK
jgi:hypothetical protein